MIFGTFWLVRAFPTPFLEFQFKLIEIKPEGREHIQYPHCLQWLGK